MTVLDRSKFNFDGLSRWLLAQDAATRTILCDPRIHARGDPRPPRATWRPLEPNRPLGAGAVASSGIRHAPTFCLGQQASFSA